jgi:hypothetical protein
MPLPLAETAPSARVALSPGEVSPSALVLANGVAPGTRLLEDSSDEDAGGRSTSDRPCGCEFFLISQFLPFDSSSNLDLIQFRLC